MANASVSVIKGGRRGGSQEHDVAVSYRSRVLKELQPIHPRQIAAAQVRSAAPGPETRAMRLWPQAITTIA